MATKSGVPAVTAKNINEAHRCARESAENAVEWAVKCGHLLAAKKDEIGRGNFDQWVADNCDFGRSSAYAYIKVAEKSSRGLDDLRSIQQALGYDKPKQKTDIPKGAVSVVNPDGGRTTGAKEGTEETGKDRPAAPVSTLAPNVTIKQQPEPEIPQKTTEVTPAPDFDFDGYEPEDDDAYKQNIENVMMADDKLAAMREELKQVHRELAAVKLSRDHYQSEAGAAVRLVKARDREIEKLKRQLAKLQERAAA